MCRERDAEGDLPRYSYRIAPVSLSLVEYNPPDLVLFYIILNIKHTGEVIFIKLARRDDKKVAIHTALGDTWKATGTMHMYILFGTNDK